MPKMARDAWEDCECKKYPIYQGTRQQQGLGLEQLIRWKGESEHHNTHNMESDNDRNLSALFQDSGDSSVKIEQEIWGAPRLPTQDADAIINQLNLKSTTHNPFLYTGYYRRHKVVVGRQR